MKVNLLGLMVIAFCLTIFSGCAMLSNSPAPAPKTVPLARLAIEGITYVNVGGSTQLTARGYDAEGNGVTINPTWTFTPPSIGDMGEVEFSPAVGSTTYVKGRKAGYVNIVVEYQGVKKVKEAFEIR